MTFVDLYNDNHREQFTTCALSLLHKIEKQKDKLPKDAEIVIMVEDYGAGVGYGYGYYLATWEDRCVFWLEDVDCDYITMQGGRVCTTETHIGTVPFLKMYRNVLIIHSEILGVLVLVREQAHR